MEEDAEEKKKKNKKKMKEISATRQRDWGIIVMVTVTVNPRNISMFMNTITNMSIPMAGLL